jgi:glucose 1-dehydrogenase
MRAITVVPGVTGSARLDELPEPDPAQGSLLVKALALGVCGTDREIVAGKLGAPPPDRQRLILGHESLGIVEEGPEDGGFERGDHVVAIVRLPDPVPCPACAAGEWDMCRNGQYVEHGIKERDGFGSERFRTDPRFTVKVDAGLGPLAILLEPTSIVAKAWDQIERIGRRSPSWRPHSVLVTGAGSIGLLAALIGKQRGLEVHLFDRSPEGPKPKLARGSARPTTSATSRRSLPTSSPTSSWSAPVRPRSWPRSSAARPLPASCASRGCLGTRP